MAGIIICNNAPEAFQIFITKGEIRRRSSTPFTDSRPSCEWLNISPQNPGSGGEGGGGRDWGARGCVYDGVKCACGSDDDVGEGDGL